MKCVINGIDFHELEPQRYWSFPKNYKGNKKTETREMILSNAYLGSRKMDGAFFKFVKNMDGKMELIGRSKGVGGDYLNKIEWVPQLRKFFDFLPCGTCVLGELYLPKHEGSSNVTKIIGCLKDKALERQEDEEWKLNYYVFDVLAYSNVSFIDSPVEKRVELLNSISSEVFPCVQFAKYYDGLNLWDKLQEILQNNGEGIVITRKHSPYHPGKRPARQTLKVKKELQDSIDCFFTGRIKPPARVYTGKEVESWEYWENEKTGEKLHGNHYKEYFNGEPVIPVTKPYFNKWAGSLEIGVIKDGKVYPIGFLSGVSDEIKANHEKYKGKPIEVMAMEIYTNSDGSLGGLRHPKFSGFREDLSLKDCTYEKIFEVLDK